MKRMRLFEIGFKDKPHQVSYTHKLYIAAVSASQAVIRARRWMIEDHNTWWEEEGRICEMADIWPASLDNMTDEQLEKEFEINEDYMAELSKRMMAVEDDLRNMVLAKLLDIGEVII